MAQTQRNFHISTDDAISWMHDRPASAIDLIITDPPYESLEKHRKRGTTTRLKQSKASSSDWFEIFSNSRFPDFFREAHRILRKNSHLYLFCDAETMFVVKPIGEAAGFKFWKPLVWDKVRFGMGYHYRARYEFILFFAKGKKSLNNFSVPDILTAPRILKGYPTQKPVGIAEILIKQSSAKNDVVCDPFCGSGSFGVAAAHTHRRFLGCDTSLTAVDITIDRMLNASASKANAIGEVLAATT